MRAQLPSSCQESRPLRCAPFASASKRPQDSPARPLPFERFDGFSLSQSGALPNSGASSGSHRASAAALGGVRNVRNAAHRSRIVCRDRVRPAAAHFTTFASGVLLAQLAFERRCEDRADAQVRGGWIGISARNRVGAAAGASV